MACERVAESTGGPSREQVGISVPFSPSSLFSGLCWRSLTAARVKVGTLVGLQGPAQHPDQEVKASTE